MRMRLEKANKQNQSLEKQVIMRNQVYDIACFLF